MSTGAGMLSVLTGARYNIVDTRDIAEAMRKLSQYEQEKRFARAKRVLDVHTSFTEPVLEVEKAALLKRVK